MEIKNAKVVYFARMIDAETAKVVGSVTYNNLSPQPFKLAVIVPAPVNARTVKVTIEDDLRNALPPSMFAAENFDFVGSIEEFDE